MHAWDMVVDHSSINRAEPVQLVRTVLQVLVHTLKGSQYLLRSRQYQDNGGNFQPSEGALLVWVGGRDHPDRIIRKRLLLRPNQGTYVHFPTV